MPKVTNTRRLKARELVKTLEQGPSFSFDTLGFKSAPDLTKNQRAGIQLEVDQNFKLWCSTWVLPQVRALIPELKDSSKL